MAEFCAECAVTVYGENTGDLAGIGSPEDTAAGYFHSCLCEGCGTFIFVDHLGIRVNEHKPETRIVDGETQHLLRPRPDEELASLRARFAAR